MAENKVNNGKQEKSYSYWSMVWRRFRRHKPAVISFVLLVIIFLFSFLGGLVWRIPPDETVPYREVFKDVISRTQKLSYFSELNKQPISYADVSSDDKLMTLLYSAPELQKPIENSALSMGGVFTWFKNFTNDAEQMAAQAKQYDISGKEMEDAFSPYLSVISVVGNELQVYNQLQNSVYGQSYNGESFIDILKDDPKTFDINKRSFFVDTVNNLLTVMHSSLTFYPRNVNLPKEYTDIFSKLQNKEKVKQAGQTIVQIEDALKTYNEYLEKQNLYLQSLQKAYDFVNKAFSYGIEEQKAALVEKYKKDTGFYSEKGCVFEDPCTFCQDQGTGSNLCDIPQGEGCTSDVVGKLCDEDKLFNGTDDEPAVCDLCGSLGLKFSDTTDFSEIDALENPCAAKIFMDAHWKGQYVAPISDIEQKIAAYENFPKIADLKAPKNMPSLKDYDFVKKFYDEEINRINTEISYYKKIQGSIKDASEYAQAGKSTAISKRMFAQKLREVSGIDNEQDPVVKQRVYSFIKDLSLQACDLKNDCKDVVSVLSDYIDSSIRQRESVIANIKADLKEYKSILKDIDYYRGVVKELKSKQPFVTVFNAAKPLAAEVNLIDAMKNDAFPVYKDMFAKVEQDVKQNKDKFQYDKLIVKDFKDFVDTWGKRDFPLDKSYYPKFIVNLAQILIPNFDQQLDDYLTQSVPDYQNMSYEEQEKIRAIYGAEFVKSILSSEQQAQVLFFGKGAQQACASGDMSNISVQQLEAIYNSPLVERLRDMRKELYGETTETSENGCPAISDLDYIYYAYNQFASFKSTVASFTTELEFKAHTYGKLYYGYGKAWYDVAGNKGEEKRENLANLVEFPHLPMFSKGHPLGTDDKGRDVLARLIFGGQVSLLVGILAVIISITVGTVIGITSGFYGGWWDNLAMRFVDIMMNIPSLPLLLALSQALRKFSNFFSETLHMGALGGAMPIALVLAIWSWMGLARLVRGQVLSVKEQQYVEAARAIGTPNSRIMFKHILPNVSAAIIVAATLQVGSAMLSEASLSFLGFGVQPPATSWGQMLQNATQIFQIPGYMYLIILPGTMLFLTVLAFNFLGDGLRDALDPRMKL